MTARFEPPRTEHLNGNAIGPAGDPFVPELVRPLLLARREADVLEAVRAATAHLGFDTFTYGAAIRMFESWEPWFTAWTTLPREWIAIYAREGFIETDPRIIAGFGKATPLLWDRRRLAGVPGCERFFAAAAPFGLSSGVAFHVHGENNEHFMVSFNSARDDCEGIAEQSVGTAYLFATHFHQWFKAALVGRKVPSMFAGQPLTPRERECLGALARGLTNGQIARSMGITDRTAAFHISHILAKLNAENRTEAVSLAVRSRLIG